MRVLMQNRVDAFENIGGDTIQMLKTKEELERLGVEVDISLELSPDLNGYDLVHLFNITRIHETWMQYKNAKSYNKKIVLSTIHHRKSDIEEYEKKALMGKAKLIKKIFNNEESIQKFKTLFYVIQSKGSFKPFFYQIKNGFLNQQKEVIEGVDIVLPNSNMELEAIINDFKFDKNKIKYFITPNGVEINYANVSSEKNKFVDKFGIENFVFCPGRIEPRKNQINIIKALCNSDMKVVFAGAINRKHKKYYKEFIKEVNRNDKFYYVGLLDREMMFEAYKVAKVGVLASWFETTGLIGLEAALGECNVVITEKGYTKEYYEDYVWYCNPSNIDSIKKAIIDAFNSEFRCELKDNIINKYSWSNAAIYTLKAYEKIID